MAKITPMPGTLNAPPRSRGAFYVRFDPKRGYIASAWPKQYRRSKIFGYQQYRQLEFLRATQMASNGTPYDMQSFQQMAEGTAFIWRDMMIQAIYGRLYNFKDLSGNNYIAWRDMNPNPQQILDLIDTTWGTILFRGKEGWFGLEGGTPGQYLQTQGVGANPVWAAASGGGGSSVGPSVIGPAPGLHGSYPPGPWLALRQVWLPSGITIKGIAMFVTAIAGAASAMSALYLATGQTAGTKLASLDSEQDLVLGYNELLFPTPYKTTQNGVFTIGISAQVNTSFHAAPPDSTPTYQYISASTWPASFTSVSGNANGDNQWFAAIAQ